MPLEPKLSNEAATAAANAVCPLVNNGYCRVYDGTKPASSDTAITSQNLLAEARYNATAFAAAVNGVATANAMTADSSINLTGTATWFRAFKSDGTSPVFDGTVGTSGCDMNIPSVILQQFAQFSVSAHTFTVNKG